MDAYLKQVMPDFQDFKNPPIGKDFKSLVIYFSKGERRLNVDFEDLSDGEKCFMICALTLAANKSYGPLVCFWDEPDNYLALSEVGHFTMGLRKGFQSQGQLIATSHNPEAIARFSYESTFLLSRRSHLEPTLLRPVRELETNGDLVGALTRGDLSP
jgi:ATPase subunit of ABC transporter with duplicated ATPase domains